MRGDRGLLRIFVIAFGVFTCLFILNRISNLIYEQCHSIPEVRVEDHSDAA